jgi:very-short-patch-repair endonuclease
MVLSEWHNLPLPLVERGRGRATIMRSKRTTSRTRTFPLPPRSGGEGSGVGGLLRTTRKIDLRVVRARQLRRDMTMAEKKLWWRLRELGAKGSHFRRQATIGPYFADFASHTTKLVIEIDGGQHGQASQITRDHKRDAYLRRNGYRVLRFWNNDIRENIEGVVTVICDALEARESPPPPTPPHRKRGEGRTRRSATS